VPDSKEIPNLPLGLIAGTGYHQAAVGLPAGDLLILYTDGINEAENEAGGQLGFGTLAIDCAGAADRLAYGCRGKS
jgi:serine phosphatase RsbU (regulator of sigma subunit)